VFGAPIDLFVEGIATATAQGEAVATADFANTIEWGGITEIRDADGTPVVDFTVISDSGVDWSEPVEAPEPGSVAMAVTGAAVLLLRSRLRRPRRPAPPSGPAGRPSAPSLRIPIRIPCSRQGVPGNNGRSGRKVDSARWRNRRMVLSPPRARRFWLLVPALLALGWPGATAAGTPGGLEVSWATMGEPAALGEPADDTVTAAVGAPLAFSGFSDTVSYAGLEAALLAAGVPPAVLADADFVAFDPNGTTGGFEGSIWTFEDGQGGTLDTQHGFGGIGAGIVFNGDMAPADYATLFSPLPPSAPFVGLILFDLSGSGVNPYAPTLSLTLEGLDQLGAGEPDPSGLGVLRRSQGDCGDGVQDAGEQCDDGNVADGDACTSACQIPVPEPAHALLLVTGASLLLGAHLIRVRGFPLPPRRGSSSPRADIKGASAGNRMPS
jgi:cysteine-rich repeat protein